jgi:hypothetical protein
MVEWLWLLLIALGYGGVYFSLASLLHHACRERPGLFVVGALLLQVSLHVALSLNGVYDNSLDQ